jgi:hypothetical protein
MVFDDWFTMAFFSSSPNSFARVRTQWNTLCIQSIAWGRFW